MEFLAGDARLLLALGDGKDPAVALRPPAKLRKKTVFFVKHQAGPLPLENAADAMLIGELGEAPLDQLNAIAQEIFVPILTNPRNQHGWPDVIAREVSDSMHKFVANVYVTIGQTLGRTMLPLPSFAGEPDAADKDLVHIIESAVVTWTRQVKAVLKLEPESVFHGAEANPGPLAEMEFWKHRTADLNSIYTQLSGDRITKVIKVLELAKSTYYTAFRRLYKEVVLARAEANHILRYLKPMEKGFEKLSMSDDFPQLANMFRPLLHQVLLVWKHSKHYNSPQRMVILMREVCNDLIGQACKFVEVDKVLSDEPADAVTQLKLVLRVLGTFKSIFFEYRTRSTTEVSHNPWKFQNSALFARLDMFLERIHELLDLAETGLQFLRLERVEIGGTSGRGQTATVKQIYAEFLKSREELQQVEYDLMDVDEVAFEADFLSFKATIRELERQLGSVITKAFDDCNTVDYTFKLLDGFEGLLDRDIIKQDLERKTGDLLVSFHEDVKTVYMMFHKLKASPPLAKNAAPHSGAVAWVRSLKLRLEGPMERIHAMQEAGYESEFISEIEVMYNVLLKAMKEFEEVNIEAWYREVANTSDDKLKLPLLIKAPNSDVLIQVNFDPALVRLLREVKYFIILGVDIPLQAQKVYEKNEVYRRQVGNLDLISTIYNQIQTTLLDIERPLVQKSLDTILKKLEKALTTLNWTSLKIDDYIAEVMAAVRELSDILSTIKGNVKKTKAVLKGWVDKPLFIRKDKVMSKADLGDLIKEHMDARYGNITEGANEIHALLSSSNRTLKASKGAKSWKDYVDYISNIVMEGLSDTMTTSLQTVYNELDPVQIVKNTKSPMLEVEIKLGEAPDGGKSSIEWTPKVGKHGDGIRDLFTQWLRRITGVQNLMKRLDVGEGSYGVELAEDYAVGDWLHRLQGLILDNEAKCMEFEASYLRFQDLWMKDPKEELALFLEDKAVRDEDGNRVSDPPLEAFAEMIQGYKDVQEEVTKLPTTVDIGWLRVTSKVMRSQLSNRCSQGIFRFTGYLQNKVQETIEEHTEFVTKANKTLDINVSGGGEDEAAPEEGGLSAEASKHSVTAEGGEGEGEAEATEAEAEKPKKENKLYEVMGCMRDIRKRKERTEAMFEPLNATVDLLKQILTGSSEIVSAATMDMLEDGPHIWKQLVKKLEAKKEEVALAQQIEGSKIRSRSDAFGEKVDKFRKFFASRAPFTVPDGKLEIKEIHEAYRLLDAFHHGKVEEYESVTAHLKEAEYLKECQDLFDLYVVDYVHLTRCEEELHNLKALWDMVAFVMFTMQDWRTTKWETIDTEMLTEKNKMLAKEIKSLNKSARTYDVYKNLEDAIKAMSTSLPLVSDLHDPAMRERHWQQLMKATGVKFVMDEHFTLGTLLDLKLHKFEEEVADIVDRAKKEEGIEKQLVKIEEAWSRFELTYEPYPEVQDVWSVNMADDVREALEQDNMALQALAGGKYVQGNPKFVEVVNVWQRKLGAVEGVTSVWFEVQKKWQNLESIFVGSQDIRVQLPDDSKRFDVVNADYQELMKSANDITNVVEACNYDGRQERLDNMFNLLETCEKALQDYLETKRVAFPRFYFVAPAELLDLLSKGSNPLAIEKHLPKCFDNIAKLIFTKDDKGKDTKTATHMVSKEGERIPFAPAPAPPCLCDGPVETWMGTLVESMKRCLSWEFKEKAMPTYEEMKRHHWIREVNKVSVQMTVVVTRVYFTSEVNDAFAELEDGNEEALKVELTRQVDQLADLIEVINTKEDETLVDGKIVRSGGLTGRERKRLIMLCTIDVHARDVIQRLIDERVEAGACFQWQSQLRYYRNEKTGEVQVLIVDADAPYNYEYIGIPGCLCITPLTDRCYITLTQAQRLMLGGAPAGPAGTGKTETVKDLARHLATMIYVFNCSDQMDFRAMGQIYKGLAQVGAWGCFDEFNRIPVSVLSVCSTQYKTVLDALRAKKERFLFEEMDIPIQKSIMAFITMNPGYPGRAELPESLKALFRPVSMVVPDLALICEIMLMAEGFQMAKILARKFVILYKLCEDLLSKSRHYDWKLRAIKTTLYVAGGMKRDAEKTEPDMTEEMVLLRALRDFNLGKLTADDTGIFMGLMNDLFPKKVDLVKRAIDTEFEPFIHRSAEKLALQTANSAFTLKISQLREIFAVRWSVFLLGPAGCGKSAIWKTLRLAQNMYGEKSDAKPINPKSVTRNELYGFLHPTTREWKEGLISTTFRNMAVEGERVYKHQWIVLDGDIDAEWIESMNTVMDDNKMLTLASNERISLTDSMRLLLEINHMVHCSPATVSRGGVIFVNQDDIGWKPPKDSWIASLDCDQYRPLLSSFFEKYIDESIDYVRRNFRTLVPIEPMAVVDSICHILEGILPMEKVPAPDDRTKKLLEMQFVFAAMWSLGGCLLVDKVTDHRSEFSRWWMSTFKTVTFPEGCQIFDCYVDEKEVSMEPWSKRVQSFDYIRDPNNFQNIFVPTVDTTRLTYLLDNLVENHYYVMFVGNSGTGKTAIMRDKLKNMNSEKMSFYTVNMNSFTMAPSLQITMEQPLVKTNVRWGPPGTKHMVYFIDDMNMPFKDKYDTQSAIELVRQYVDYGGWYDKTKIVERKLSNCLLSAAMNPTAGSFTITPRMQRHFKTFAVLMPPPDLVRTVYSQIIESHLEGFENEVYAIGPKIVDAMIELHKNVMNNFMPSAVKFHYQWNLRELSNITQGITRMRSEVFGNPVTAVRLLIHECERVFLDRMVSDTDAQKFEDMRRNVIKKHFSDLKMDEIEERPILFNSFIEGPNEDFTPYLSVPGYEKLSKVLNDNLKEYNETNAVMNLVLFQQAMEHVCRISRILDLPCGNAMLVGVGGSGRQSLARLAAFCCLNMEVFQITVTSSYGVDQLKENILSLYTKTGMKGNRVMFLMTDNQIVDERFLVYINDLLASGFIADLCAPEDRDNFMNAVRNEAKAAGVLETPENLWDFFIAKVRRNLHIVLCFSPTGDKFRVRARQFPALVTSTVFDWFHPWPHEALVSVANRFLGEIPDLDEEVKENIAYHMALAHLSVTEGSVDFLRVYRRYNYVTPKSYLELISLYTSLLASQRNDVRASRERLENGLDKIAEAAAQVADLQVMLKQEQIVVAEKQEKTRELIEFIGKEKAVVEEAVEASRGDEEAAAVIAENVTAQQEICTRELSAAEPLIAAAEEALGGLEKSHLTELKSLKTPAKAIEMVCYGCQVLFADPKKLPKEKDLTWQGAQKFMGDAGSFLAALTNFNKENLDLEPNVTMVEAKFKPDMVIPGTDEPAVEDLKKKSAAAAGVAAWVVNICKFFRVFQKVKPMREALDLANSQLEGANKKLSGVRAKVAALNEKVAALEEQFAEATDEKNKAIAQAEKTQSKADLADRLINGLASERKRWGETVEQLKVQEGRLVGDVLLASAFVSYAGPFNMPFRVKLVSEKWMPDLIERKIPMSDEITPIKVLANQTIMAKWNSEGLPSDPLSLENGAIMTNSSRWPLMIDPQLQGITWILKREEANGIKVIQLTQNKYIDTVKACIENGLPLIIEKLDEDIDAVLDSVVSRSTIKKGRNLILKIGDDEVSYDPRFKLYLQTKLANPHYKPEIAAQTTLVNFCVTEKGLEDQLLALVVAKERPDMQKQATELVDSLTNYSIQLAELEDSLLQRLASVQGDILEDVALVENLELTKVTSSDIAQKVELANETSATIAVAREVYRPVATRGSLVYFMVDNLNALDRVYHYSMANFVRILNKSMEETPLPDESVPEKDRLTKRVADLIDNVTFTIFKYVAQGLFERHKLIVATQLAIMILKSMGQLDVEKFDYLLRGPKVEGIDNPLRDFVSDGSWAAVQALKEIELFNGLADELIGSQKRWKEWMELQRPEEEAPPGDWKRQPEFDRLLLFRALRPDRLTAAMRMFVARVIGEKYVTSYSFDLQKSMLDSAPHIPLFVFLSPGVDVAAAVEAEGAKLGFTSEAQTYATISLGQGQEEPAARALSRARKEGGWVLLQNVHLTIDWTSSELVKMVDKLVEDTHEDFRLFISAEPPPALERMLPISVLQASIKLTNEPPEGLKANLIRAWSQYNDEVIENCSKQAELRSILFALCYFHAVILERKKFGVGNMPASTSGIGWNMNYPFNTGDLLCCGQVAINFLEGSTKVPWDDLRYVVGEIMYGGHVVEDWDRRLSNAYLMKYFNEELLDGVEMFPGFNTPPNTATHKEVIEYIDETLKSETPTAYGLHPNAEIGFKLREAEAFCQSVLNLQPRTAGGEGGLSEEERAKQVLDDIVEKLPDIFDMEDIRNRCDGDFSPYTMVAIQEAERMNVVIVEMKRSLIELDLGLKGDLTMTGPMESLMSSLASNQTPGSWAILAYPSLRPLASWFLNLLQRYEQLMGWTSELAVPVSVWLSGLFNPQSFLTAVKQTTARRNEWPLDKTEVITEVTKRVSKEQVEAAARDGAYIHGLTMEGARWDEKAMCLEDSLPKQLFCPLPVILVKAVQVDRADIKDAYQTPVYTTEARFRQEVFTAQLKSKTGQLKWILAGVAAFLDVVL